MKSRLFFLAVLLYSPCIDLFAESFALPKVSFQFGKCYLQLKRAKVPRPQALVENQTILDIPPYAWVTAKDSFLEISGSVGDKDRILRLGRSTIMELKLDRSYFFYKGSALFCKNETSDWDIRSENARFQFSAKGTWLIERTPLGFKTIVLEGELYPKSINKSQSGPILPGELALITGDEGLISQTLKVELPVLLSTSRLINNFPSALPSQNKLISAAQVQSIRTKTRYNAFIGGVSQDSKLRIWSPSPTKMNEEQTSSTKPLPE